MAIQTHFRTCNLCEAMCGLEIKHEDTHIISIAGDKNDPFSRGHICPKAVALKDIYEDPNRLKRPVKRTPEGWQEISWDEAFTEVVDRLKAIQTSHGVDSVAVYAGNPSVHNSGTFMSAPGFIKALGTRNRFSASSVDQYPHHLAAWQLFGHPLLMPVPDIDHTDYWLIIGGNPIASNGSIMTAPDVANRLKAIQQRGGKVVVIDPRYTETAAKASEHVFIRPQTDAFLLMAMVHVLFQDNLVNMGRLADFTDGLDELRALVVTEFSPESVETITGVPAHTIRRLTHEFANAAAAACYGRVGVSTQTFGSISLWLINVINILTGHLDKPGGMMFTSPAIDVITPSKPYDRFGRYQSRVRGLPEFMGELPVSALSEEILTPGVGQLKALVTSCGNPVLSTPNGQQLDQALESLEFMVSIDIYINETTRHAHIILPPATGLETAHYDVTFHYLAIRNTAKYSVPMLPKDPEAKFDWEIFEELRLRIEQENVAPSSSLANPEAKLDLGLRFGSYGKTGLSIQTLKDNPHGVDLGALVPRLPERLATPTKRIQLLPALYSKDLQRLRQEHANFSLNPNSLLLIGRRHLRDNNSWMHNSERLVKGRNRCTLQIHPDDAATRNLQNGQIVRVKSRVGEVEIAIEITDHMMKGVLSMPHGYGHWRKGVRLDVATQHAGVSINDLTDELQVDELTGNAAFNGVAVELQAL
ncbi:MAG: molybdopterin oxidoreductase family protein [Spirosomataceae bacterium]